jgi:putative ABC transport system ATP-binding protein
MALLSLSTIHKTFEKGTVNENHVLRGLDLDIEQGDFISVIGGNGAGKSTLMNSIAGVVEIDEGDIVLDGQSIRKASVAARSKDISRVFQDPRMGTATNLTIEENMAIAYRRGKKRSFFKKSITETERQLFKEKLAELGLGLENRMKTDAAFLSGGQRQALTLAMATLVRPKILLLDEHTAFVTIFAQKSLHLLMRCKLMDLVVFSVSNTLTLKTPHASWLLLTWMKLVSWSATSKLTGHCVLLVSGAGIH